MDGKLEEELKSMSKKLETTLEIIMEHFRETEDRMEAMEDTIEELKNGFAKISRK
jgi:flagellar capping protein FliD